LAAAQRQDQELKSQMQYKYATEQPNYSDFSSGRVFYSLPGHPAFPVRLASEIFQRCLAHRATIYQASTPVALYDPCCGAAYHLSVLAYLHGEHIREVIASDIDEKAVALAKRNLGLLSIKGLDERIREISELYEQYGKDSHKAALESASALKNRLSTVTAKHPLEIRAFRADALEPQEILKGLEPKSIDLVFTDVPYGWHSHWQASAANQTVNPIHAMLETLLGTVSPSSLVAIVSDKQQKVAHERYQRIEHFQVGKRRVVVLKPGQDR
jgi:tRNA G10  N-methylase Trm11